MIPAIIIAALLALAVVGKGDPLPCEPNLCTEAQLDAEVERRAVYVTDERGSNEVEALSGR